MSAQFTVQGRYIKDPQGNNFFIRGVNVATYGNGWSGDLIPVADAIKNNTKSNAVRLLWYSPKIQNALGNPPFYSSLQYLDDAITAYAQRGKISIVFLRDLLIPNPHDHSVAGFNNYIVPFWTDPAVITLINNHKNHLIINLANEWGVTWGSNAITEQTFVNTYTNLIVQLRNLGVTVPIMIDAPNYGANYEFTNSVGNTLINNDPLHRLIFSVHTYWSQENQYIQNCPADYLTKIDNIKNSNLPYVLGEVSSWCVDSNGVEHQSVPPVNFNCPGTASPNRYAINYDALLTRAVNNEIGFLAWNWYQDGMVERNIYDQSGTAQNNSPNAGSWPADILSSTKIYGLNNANISTLASAENNVERGIKIFPNPSTGMFKILSDSSLQNISVTDASGKSVSVSTLGNSEYKIDAVSGMYFIKAQFENGKTLQTKLILKK